MIHDEKNRLKEYQKNDQAREKININFFVKYKNEQKDFKFS